MVAPLEEIEFLVRSKNRVAVLRLVAEGMQTRRDLATATGASQATLGRILEDFTERSWVRREGAGYVATATGVLVADGIGDLVTVFETEAKLRDVIAYLPTAQLSFDLRRLADANVVVPTRTRPSAPLQHVLEAMADADSLRAFSHTLNEQSLSVAHDRVQSGDGTFEAVLSASAIEALAVDDRLWDRLRSLAESEDASIRVRREDIPLAVTITDDAVTVLVRDDDGILRASIHTADRAVHEWAEGTFTSYWESAESFDPTTFER
ncbi:helix-turn-helix transcriptional regulator [Halorubrum vacuolatum]|uniref:Predicted transcriptional regulator, contains HTH domain n=1 Tax=Halorubrum vacuolatum TaxID=63740 RepID=A0A238VB93_HALVU|nr:transcriptional regulator FilR1 domain-containing protein [Halorubrum vacuolatum]SNR31680.1 Predicted transcriptional regulator, contains HTH domain [Halorubrum vacuolatum]